MKLMLRHVFLLLAISVVATAGAGDRQEGLTATQFSNLASSFVNLPGRIDAVQIFHVAGNQQDSVAIATFEDSAGWQLAIFNPAPGGKYVLGWKSGKLDDSFAVSSPGALRISSLANEQAIVFDGCASHACPDVFSILLYVPSAGGAFTAQYVWGKIAYSPNLEEAKYAQYKSILANLVRKHKGK